MPIDCPEVFSFFLKTSDGLGVFDIFASKKVQDFFLRAMDSLEFLAQRHILP